MNTKERNIIIENENFQLIYEPQQGVFNLKRNNTNYYTLSNAISSITFEYGGELSTRKMTVLDIKLDDYMFPRLGQTKRFTVFYQVLQKGTLCQEFFIPRDKPYMLMRIKYRNTDEQIQKIATVNILDLCDDDICGTLYLGSSPENYSVYTNTYYKTPSCVRDVFDGFNSEELKTDIKYMQRDSMPGWQSKYDGSLYDKKTHNAIVFGAVTFERFMVDLKLAYEKASERIGMSVFKVANLCEYLAVLPQQEICSEIVYLNFCDDVFTGQMEYARLTGVFMKAKFLKYPLAGWCSWHYKFYNITEEDVLRNAHFVAQHPEIFPNCPGGFEYIQVDCGWQRYLGSSEIEYKQFPHGMRWLCDQIHGMNLKAGIWIAPFWIEDGASIVKDHPEYLLHDKNGQLLKAGKGFKCADTYRLDISHPDARAYVIAQLDKIINDWGYDMIKMDFLEMGTVRPFDDAGNICYYDDSKTSYEHFRDVCRLINDYVESTGKDIFISPCGSPLMFTIGIFRSNYVAEDALFEPYPDEWNGHAGVKSFVRGWASRYYMSGRIWTNNCESVVIRPPRPLNEVRVSLTAGALTGGVLFEGDELFLLSTERLNMYSKILPLYNKTALPIDLYTNADLTIWDLKVETPYEIWDVVGLFNLTDKLGNVELDFSKLNLSKGKFYHVFEFWNNDYLGCFNEKCVVKGIPARDVRLVCIREAKPFPWILSTNVHFTQGAAELDHVEWDNEQLELRIRLTDRRYQDGVIFVYVPKGYKTPGLLNDNCILDYKITGDIKKINDVIIIPFTKV